MQIRKSSIFMLTIWILVFLSLLGTVLYKIISARLRLVKAVEGRVVSVYLAKAACWDAQKNRQDDRTDYDTFFELGQDKELTFGRSKVVYSLLGEESRININKVSQDVLMRLEGVNKELAAAIFNSEYKPFNYIQELFLVEGMTEDIFEGIKGLITVYGEGSVNINTASSGVLKTLGLDDNLARVIVNFRKGKDNKPGTEDDGFFESSGEILDKLREYTGLFQKQQAQLLQLISQGLLDVKSSAFFLDIKTFVLNRPAMRYNIIFDKDGIKSWQEF